MATSLDKLVNNLSEDALNNVKRYYAEDKLNLEKAYIPTNIWIHQKSYKKLNYHQKKRFILDSMTKVSVTRITQMRKKFGKRLR